MMIYPRNKRSAVYAVANLINRHGPMSSAQAAGLLVASGGFSERTIKAACWQMKREFMADEDGAGQYTLRPHIVKFFADEKKIAAGEAPPLVPPRVGNVFSEPMKRAPSSARPMRPGADDYKKWPSHFAPIAAPSSKYEKGNK
jgi:hypothetical protein